MDDDELVKKLKQSAPRPPELDDERFWADFAAGVARGIDGAPGAAPGAPRARRWRLPAAVLGFAAAAAAAVLVLRGDAGAPPSHPMPGVVRTHIAEDELLGSGDATELIGDLDLEELKAVDHHFNGGV